MAEPSSHHGFPPKLKLPVKRKVTSHAWIGNVCSWFDDGPMEIDAVHTHQPWLVTAEVVLEVAAVHAD